MSLQIEERIYKLRIGLSFTGMPLQGTLISKTMLDEISDIGKPESNYRESSYLNVSRSGSNINQVITTIDIWRDTIYIMRQGEELIIDEFKLSANNTIEYNETYHYGPATENYYGIDFFFHPESNAFYVLERDQGIPQITVYEIAEQGELAGI